MRRWDVMVGVSGVIAVLAFAFLIAVMVNPQLAGFSAPAYAALAAGALGIIIGMVGMSRETETERASVETEDDIFSMGRLDVYRHLQRGRDRGSDE